METLAFNELQERYGNKKAIVSIYMEKSTNLLDVSSDANISGLRLSQLII